ncbi:MAG: tRNA epoxyqueuosine(34) reductase QueG [Balneolaceae bacterium]
MDRLAATVKVRQRAFDLGFDACGFARAGPLDKEARRLEAWLQEGRHGNMEWMERHFDKRTDPTKLVPGAKSVISVLASYHFKKNLDYDAIPDAPKIAKYARGRDYHKVFKQRLKWLFQDITEMTGDVRGRVFVDSAPVMDKVWAEKAGLGWIGKNTNLLNRSLGSFFLIGEIILDTEYVYDSPAFDHCGSCTRCIDACPTDALDVPYRIDSNRCISYLTIELRENIPPEFRKELGEWMFGCDICQDVCPWNSRAKEGRIEDLQPREKLFKPDAGKWRDLTEEAYNSLFEGTPVRRAKYKKFKQTAGIVADNLSS